MSYPRVIQALVIEDDLGVKDYYDAVFRELVTSGMAVEPIYAFCHQDALRLLQENKIYHLVILDLRLPNSPGLPASDDHNVGISLLDECRSRDRYPIPALIIRSAYLGDTDQGELRRSVESGFSYGNVFVKSGQFESELETAIQRILSYCDVGIHLRGADAELYPLLSPRDEDLLRRCVLHGGNLGVDLEWWSSGYSSAPGQLTGWTKVLVGRFIMGGGMGVSYPTFFKFTPIGAAASIDRGIGILSQKLPHVNLVFTANAGDRSIVVTRKVGENDGPPISLEDYFSRQDAQSTHGTASIANDLVRQIQGLGTVSPNTRLISQLLWKHDHVAAQWKRWADDEEIAVVGEVEDPVRILQKLLENTTPIRYLHQTCLHGDLNATNVALDVAADEVRAYVFDAGWCTSGVSVRDLAMLEVTTLLHQRKVEENLVLHCACMYRDSIEPPSDLDFDTGSDSARNTLRFIAELRLQAMRDLEKPGIYALMVFDNALMQLGGLHYQISSNKIREPFQAAQLVALTATWLRKVAPEFLAS